MRIVLSDSLSSLIWVIALLITNTASAQTFDTLGNVTISVKVTYDLKTEVFSYRYMVTNPATSTGRIDRFEIDISRPSDTAPLDLNGLSVGDSEATLMVDMDYAEQESLTTSIGFQSRPRGWTVAISRERRIVWSGKPMILPGESLATFALQSKGLPSIRSARVEPYFDVGQWPNVDQLPSVDATDSVMHLMDSLRNTVLAKHVESVGPRNMPSRFDGPVFLDTLNSYVNQSRSIGWIQSDTTSNKYIAFFDSIKAQVLQGGIQRARLILDRVIADTEQDVGGVITNEAYALLKFNSEYLRSRLQ